MSTPLHEAVRRLASGESLSATLAADAFGAIMEGDAPPTLIAALLLGLRARGETADEIAGAARALRNAMLRVPVAENLACVDTCGTGGGSVTTINISTAAALVTAAAGVAVAKHGNRSFTSQCGSADVLAALRVPVPQTPEAAAEMLRRSGIVFLFAPHFHPAMRHAAPVRRELAVPTIFNIVGPLANPAAVRRQVVGVADRGQGATVAQALASLGTDHALVVHGRAGLDEISPVGESDVWEVRGPTVTAWALEPADFGLAARDLDTVRGADPQANAERLEGILRHGTGAPGYEAVVLNAAAGVYVSGTAVTFAAAVERARAALDSGEALDLLEAVRTNSDE